MAGTSGVGWRCCSVAGGSGLPASGWRRRMGQRWTRWRCRRVGGGKGCGQLGRAGWPRPSGSVEATTLVTRGNGQHSRWWRWWRRRRLHHHSVGGRWQPGVAPLLRLIAVWPGIMAYACGAWRQATAGRTCGDACDGSCGGGDGSIFCLSFDDRHRRGATHASRPGRARCGRWRRGCRRGCLIYCRRHHG